MYLDLERNRCTGDMSPPSDNVIFDNQCYATTPSSSNGNSDMEQPNHCSARRYNGQTYHQQHHPQQQQQQHHQQHHHPYQQQNIQHQQQQQQQQQNMQQQQNIQQQQQQNMQPTSTPGSPTSRLLLEYEMHLRNTLAKGMDAESYSLHTFEALLTQSMENLGQNTPQLRFIYLFIYLYSFFVLF